MIDIHNHILPELDDGSQSLDVTEYYLEKIIEAKMEAIVFTPHYMRGFYDNTKDIILENYKVVQDIISNKNYNIKTYCSAEVYLMGSESVGDIQNNAFMINGSRYILVENSLTGFSHDLFENLFKLIKLGYKPILAHPERYLEIREKPILVEDFMHREVYMQINTASILGGYGNRVRDVAFELIDRGYAHFLGTDCHCHSGIYDYTDALDVIRKEFDDKTAHLLSKEYPQMMLNNENVPYFYVYHAQLPKKKGFFQKLFGY